MKRQLIHSSAFPLLASVLFATLGSRLEAQTMGFNLTGAQLQSDYIDRLGRGGNRPARLTSYLDTGGQVRYFTRWVTNSDRRSFYVGSNLDNDALVFQTRACGNAGMRLIDVSVVSAPQGLRYSLLCDTSRGGQNQIFVGRTEDQMRDLRNTIGQAGWRPRRIEGYQQNGGARFVSLWEFDQNSGYRMRERMTRNEYENELEALSRDGFGLVHLDAYVIGGNVYYAGIWNRQDARPRVRSDLSWRTYVRINNNSWAEGRELETFYAVDAPEGTRLGGIWVYHGSRNINAASPLELRVRQIVDGAPARGGAAFINLTTGAETMTHGDSEFAIASTIKIGILYSLLREVDARRKSLNDRIGSGTQYGKNQDLLVAPNQLYSASELAGFMIRASNNWATNRLITYLGRDVINRRLGDLGLQVTRLHRYMTGTGSPSAHGGADVDADRNAGYENLSTPLEMVTLLRAVHQGNALSQQSQTLFWDYLGMDADGGGTNRRNYVAGALESRFADCQVWNMAGSVTGGRNHRADAGLFRLANGQEVLFAIFMDNISDQPGEESASEGTLSAAEDAIKNAALEAAIEYRR